jgi:hypothetical protein
MTWLDKRRLPRTPVQMTQIEVILDGIIAHIEEACYQTNLPLTTCRTWRVGTSLGDGRGAVMLNGPDLMAILSMDDDQTIHLQARSNLAQHKMRHITMALTDQEAAAQFVADAVAIIKDKLIKGMEDRGMPVQSLSKIPMQLWVGTVPLLVDAQTPHIGITEVTMQLASLNERRQILCTSEVPYHDEAVGLLASLRIAELVPGTQCLAVRYLYYDNGGLFACHESPHGVADQQSISPYVLGKVNAAVDKWAAWINPSGSVRQTQ